MAMELQQLMNAQFPHELVLKIRMRAFLELFHIFEVLHAAENVSL